MVRLKVYIIVIIITLQRFYPGMAQTNLAPSFQNPDSLKAIASNFLKANPLPDDKIENTFSKFYHETVPIDSIEYLYTISHIFFLKNDYVKAIKYGLLARNPDLIAKNKWVEAELLLQIGYSYQRLSFFAKALYYYNLALKLEGSSLPEYRKTRTFIDIGHIYLSQNNNDSALFYYEHSLKLAENTNDTLNIIASLINIGNLHLKKQNYDKAREITQRALDLSNLTKSDFHIICFFNLGQIYFEKNDLNNSEKFYNKSLNAISPSRFENLIPEIYRYMANIEFLKGNYSPAIQNCRLFQQNTHKYYGNFAFHVSLKIIDKLLLSMIEQPGAKELLQTNIKLSDSLFRAEIETKKSLEESYSELYQLERSLKVLEQENLINKQKLNLSKVVLLLVFITLSLTFLIIIVLWRAKNKISRQNEIIKNQLEDITHKNRETLELNHEIVTQAEKISEQNQHLTKYQNHLEQLIEERTLALSKALERARESDNLKTAFLQNMSHEIRTPLNAISGFSQLLLSEETKKHEFVKIINQNIFDLIEMVENIMIFSKIHSNQLKIRKTEFQIEMLTTEILREIPDIKYKNNNPLVNFRIESEVNPGMRLYSDLSSLKKILLQLIENSFKFTEKGEISAKFRTEGTLLICQVSDTGIGIKSDQIEHIFEVFRKIEGEHKFFRGTGIGLAIVKKLTEMLNGEIEVNSEFGKGTCITLKLQCKPE